MGKRNRNYQRAANLRKLGHESKEAFARRIKKLVQAAK